MPRFLLDANLSPRIGKHLSVRLGLDVASLYRQGLKHLSDRDVVAHARRQERVVIPLDSDFLEFVALPAHEAAGIILLDLPSDEDTSHK